MGCYTSHLNLILWSGELVALGTECRPELLVPASWADNGDVWLVG
jgi:hypothetical protein